MRRVFGVVFLFAVSLMAASNDSEKPFLGSGTFDDPYLISNFKELKQMGRYKDSVDGIYGSKGGSYFKLTNDIVMDSSRTLLGGAKPFFLDGDNHKITDVQGGRPFPLFIKVPDNSWIKNLKLEALQTVEGAESLLILRGI